MRPRGFTLIELLVVVVIIAVLIAILVPVIGSMQRSARLTQCGSNLRQIGQALLNYRSQHRGWPVVKMLFFDEAPRGPIEQMDEYEARIVRAPVLPVALKDYLKPDSPVYRCPGDTEGLVYDRARTRTGHGQSYYEWFPLLGTRKTDLAPDVDRKFVMEILLHDFGGVGWQGGYIEDPKFHPRPDQINVLYTDGRVEPRSTATPK